MSQGVPFRYQDLPLRDRRQGWKQGQGAPRERGASCCVSHFQLILSGRSTCSTLSGVPSPWRHDPDKFSDRLPRYAERNGIILSISASIFFLILSTISKSRRGWMNFNILRLSRMFANTNFNDRFFDIFKVNFFIDMYRWKAISWCNQL